MFDHDPARNCDWRTQVTARASPSRNSTMAEPLAAPFESPAANSYSIAQQLGDASQLSERDNTMKTRLCE